MSESLENCIVGPRGEGKTEAGIMAMTVHSTRQDKSFLPCPWAIIRDTWSNLERTTLKSFREPRPGSFAASILPALQFKDGGKQISLPGYWDAYLFGMDSLADLSKLQSMQLSGIWMEEPAPAAEEDIGAGIMEDVLLLGITSLRHPGTRRTQITMNYPDEDHWTWVRYFINGIGRLFRIPKGENKFVDQAYRDNMAKALSGKPSLLARLVEGRPYQVQIGEAVTPEYNANTHRSTEILNPLPRVECLRFWDGGLNPTCVIGQITPRGFFYVLDTLRGENIGMKQLIMSHVKPLLASRYKEITSWADYGDESLANREQSDSEHSAAEVIEQQLHTYFRGGEQSWESRLEAWKDLLTRMIDGKPMFQVSKHEGILHRALNGGWHYYKDTRGKVLNDKPVKDIHSHPGDAVSHGIAMIFHPNDAKKPKQTQAIADFDPLETFNQRQYIRQELQAQAIMEAN